MDDGVTLVRRVIEEIWNRGELALADQLFAPCYVNHGGLIPDLVHGPEAVKISVALIRRAFPLLRIDIEDLVGDQETVALRWIARGTGAGTSGPTTPEALTGMMFLRLDGGHVTESWTTWDAVGAMDHLGGIMAGQRRTNAQARTSNGAL